MRIWFDSEPPPGGHRFLWIVGVAVALILTIVLVSIVVVARSL